MALIQDEARRLPDTPGVYRMIGDEAEVLYVGKARSLKKRVTHYAQGRFHTQRIAHMVHLTRSMEFTTTRTETEALLLESNLIKRLKPKFNVVLRDDKSFAEILLRRDHPAPQIRKHRGQHTTPGDYFGPFASTWAVNRTVNILQKAFLLRSCSDSVFDARTRPCMLHQIKRCSAPCVDLISPPDYMTLVEEAHEFLTGKSRAVMGRLSAEMTAAAEDMEFERAARCATASAPSRPSVHGAVDQPGDGGGGRRVRPACRGRAGVRAGVLLPRRPELGQPRLLSPREHHDRRGGGGGGFGENGAILDAFLGQFYEDKPVPKAIFLSHDVPNRASWPKPFCISAGRKVEITVPQRGEKRELVHHALTNAREALGRKMAESSAQSKLWPGCAKPSAWKVSRSGSRSTTTPTSWARTRWAA